MENLHSLGNDITNLKKQIDMAKEFLENDKKPPNCDSIIQQFRANIGDELVKITAKHAELPSHSLTTKHSRKLLENIEQLVDKRELHLAQYGYKPTKGPVPQYPIYTAREETNLTGSSASNKRKGLEGCQNSPEKHKKMHASSKTKESLLIAKYTPRKEKHTPADYKCNDGIYSALGSKYKSDAGDKTYTIKCEVPQHDTVEKTVDRLVTRYSIAPNDFKRNNPAEQINSAGSSSTSALNESCKRFERYSVIPPKQPVIRVAPSSTPEYSTAVTLLKYATIQSQSHNTNKEVVVLRDKPIAPDTLNCTSYGDEFVAVPQPRNSTVLGENVFERTTLISPNSPVFRSVPGELPSQIKQDKPGFCSIEDSNLLSEKAKKVDLEKNKIAADDCDSTAAIVGALNMTSNLLAKYGNYNTIDDSSATGDETKITTKKESSYIIDSAINNENVNPTSAPVEAPLISKIFAKYGSKYNAK